MYIETRARSIIKTISWRATATCATIILVFIFTGNIKLSASVGGVEVFTKLLLYYLHERVWGKINMGKTSAEDKVNSRAPEAGHNEMTAEKSEGRCLKSSERPDPIVSPNIRE